MENEPWKSKSLMKIKFNNSQSGISGLWWHSQMRSRNGFFRLRSVSRVLSVIRFSAGEMRRRVMLRWCDTIDSLMTRHDGEPSSAAWQHSSVVSPGNIALDLEMRRKLHYFHSAFDVGDAENSLEKDPHSRPSCDPCAQRKPSLITGPDISDHFTN